MYNLKTEIMKRLALTTLLAAVLIPLNVMGQSFEDDLYYTPSQEKTTNVYVPKGSQVVIESNEPITVERPSTYSYEYSLDSDYNYNLDGEWIDGFEGSQDDFEYCMRKIQNNAAMYRVSVSSPYYWDFVHGQSSFDWNIYVTVVSIVMVDSPGDSDLIIMDTDHITVDITIHSLAHGIDLAIMADIMEVDTTVVTMVDIMVDLVVPIMVDTIDLITAPVAVDIRCIVQDIM